jgi:copper transport protein
VLLSAGVVRAVLEIDTVSGLWDTTYGRLVLAKAALLLPLLALGARNHRAVAALRRGAAEHGFGRRMAAELAVLVVVLGVTAVLTGEPPARAAAGAQPFSTSTQLGPYELDLDVDPAQAGPNQIHVYLLDASGRPAQASQASLTATDESRGIGPLTLRTQRGGPGHWIVAAAPLTLPGTWNLRVTARRGEFDQWSTTIPVPIKEP